MREFALGAVGIALAIVGTSVARADMGPHLEESRRADASLLTLEANLDLRAGKKRSLGRQITSKLTLWSNEIGSHLNLLTMDLVDLDFDVDGRHANVRIGTLAQKIGFRVDGDIEVRSNVARVKSRLAFGVSGDNYVLDLPVFEVVTQDVGGERSVELRLPIIEGRF